MSDQDKKKNFKSDNRTRNDNDEDDYNVDLKNEDVEEKVESVSKKEDDDLPAVEKQMYVSWPRFIEIKYGITTIEELNCNPSVAIIVGQWIKAKEADARLRLEGCIVDECSESEKESIKRFADYLEYTSQKNIVVLTIEKAILVLKKITTEFSFIRRLFSLTFSFTYMSKEYKLHLEGALEFLRNLYDLVGKKMTIVEFPVNYEEDIANIWIEKNYTVNGVIDVPNHLVALKSVIREKFDIDGSPYFYEDSKERIVGSVLNATSGYPELTVTPGTLVEGKKLFAGRSMHDLDGVLKSKSAQLEERSSLAVSIARMLKVEGLDKVILELLEDLPKIYEGNRSTNSETKEIGEFNVSWLSVPKMARTEEERSRAGIRDRYVAKFAKDKYVFFYVRDSAKYIFVKHEKGRVFLTVKALVKFLNLLPRLFHVFSLLGHMHDGDAKAFMENYSSIVDIAAKKLSTGGGSGYAIIYNQMIMNLQVWMRPIVVVNVGEIKEKYLPTKGIMDEADAPITNKDEKVVHKEPLDIDAI
jgi:hypothetical protein